MASMTLVRLHGRRNLVLVVNLHDADLVTLDSTLAVQECDVVVVARAQYCANNLRRAGAIALQADDDLLVPSLCCTRDRECAQDERSAEIAGNLIQDASLSFCLAFYELTERGLRARHSS